MSLFKKKETVMKKETIPKLPELPPLPELPGLDDISSEPLHQLPSFPSNSIGEKFSQDSIKHAISGKKVGEEVETDDFEDMQMMSRPLDEEEDYPEEINPRNKIIQNSKEIGSRTEPIFIKLDKFEESLEIFKNTKEKLTEMEKMMKDIKSLKEREQRELTSWENDMQSIKKQIEKVDREIFSRI